MPKLLRTLSLGEGWPLPLPVRKAMREIQKNMEIQKKKYKKLEIQKKYQKRNTKKENTKFGNTKKRIYKKGGDSCEHITAEYKQIPKIQFFVMSLVRDTD